MAAGPTTCATTRPTSPSRIDADASPPPPRRCCASRTRLSPRPWSLGLFVGELATETAAAATSWPGSGAAVVGFAGMLFVGRRRPRHHHRGRSGRGSGNGSAPGCCWRCAAQAVERGVDERSPSRCGPATSRRQALYRRFGFAPAGIRKNYYAGDQRGRARDVGPRRRRAPSTRRASTRIEAAVPGRDRRRGARRLDDRRASAIDRHAASSASRRRATRPPRRSSSTASDVLSSVVSSQVDLHARFGGVVPEIASRAHVELLTPVVAQALRRGRHRATTDIDAVAATVGPGPGRRAARRRERGQGAGPRVGRAVRRPSTTSRPTSTPPSSRSPTSSCRSSCCSCRAATRCSCSMEGHGRYRLLGSDHRRRRRRGVRQGRPLPRPRLPGRPGHRPPRHGGRPARPSPSPGRCSTTATTSPSAASRPRSSTTCASTPTCRTADVAASFQEAVVDVLVTKARRAARERRRQGPVPWPAAWPPTPSCASGCSTPAWPTACAASCPSRAMCTDNAAMVAAAGWWRLQSDGPSPLDTGADPNLAPARPSDPSSRVDARAATADRRGESLALGRVELPRVSTRTMRVLIAQSRVQPPTEALHMNLQPLDDRIVVKPNEAEETTASGLVIPDTAKEKPQQGEVLAVGPGRRSEQTGELIPARRQGRRHRRLLEVRRHRDHRSTARTSSSSPPATSSPSSSRSATWPRS